MLRTLVTWRGLSRAFQGRSRWYVIRPQYADPLQTEPMSNISTCSCS